MPANIYSSLFYGRREPAWHRDGVVAHERESARESFERMVADKGDLDIRKYPVVAMDPATGKPVVNPRTGEPISIDRDVIIRMPYGDDDEAKVFNFVSDKHHNLTNIEVVDTVEPIVLSDANPNGVWELSSMGVLDEGRAFFITLDAGEWEIKGDPMKNYLFVRDGKDGQRSLNIGITPVRIVCTNTEKLGLELANINIPVAHDRNVRSTLDLYVTLLPQIKNAMERTKERRARLAEFKADEAVAQEVIDFVFPTPKENDAVTLHDTLQDENVKLTEEQYEALQKLREKAAYRVERVEAIKEGTLDLWRLRNEEIQPRELAGTAHILYNAIVENCNFRRGRTKAIGTSVMMGERAMQMERAFSKLDTMIEEGALAPA